MSVASPAGGTLMSRAIFEALSNLRSTLNDVPGLQGRLANVMVPWCGTEMCTKGGVYYIGISTLGDGAESDTWSFEDCLSKTEETLADRNTPFFDILDELCSGLLRCSRGDALARLGYSNLFKIHVTTSSDVDKWPRPAAESQKATALAALRAELAELRHCLVYIGSEKGYGIFPEAVGLTPADFKQEGADLVCPRWHWDSSSNNLYVWAYHAGYLSRQGANKRQKHVDFVVALAGHYGLRVDQAS